MDEAFIYLIKVNIALVVFYLFYRLLFSQDTFFVKEQKISAEELQEIIKLIEKQ